MVKVLKSLLLIIVIATLMMVFIIDKYDLSLKASMFAILFFISVMCFNGVIVTISWNLCENSKIIMRKKYKIFKMLNRLNNNNQLDSFEDFCIKDNNVWIISEIQILTEGLNYEEIEKCLTEENYDKIKACATFNTKKANKKIDELIEDYNKPAYPSIFFKYYNNEILTKMKSPYATLFAFFSFVLSIVSLVGFNSFALLNLELYISFSIPIVITIVSSLITYKFDRKKIEIIHDELIENLNSLLEDFEKEKNRKKNSN